MFQANNSLLTRGFNPLSLAPALWLSDTGSDTSQWDDISGNGRHATQATSGNRPSIVANVRNGRQVRRFDGVNDQLNISFQIFSILASGRFTTFTVSSRLSGTNSDVISQSGSTVSLGSINGANWGVGGGVFGGSVVTTTPLVGAGTNSTGISNTFRLLSFVKLSNTSIESFTNGTTNGAATIANSNFRNVTGIGTFFSNVDVTEIIVFQTVLTTTQRQQVESYLNSKYAIF
jgi:hypothetical protein